MLLTPVLDGFGNLQQVFELGGQRDGALGRYQVYPGVETGVDLVSHRLGAFRKQRDGVVYVTHQSDSAFGEIHRLLGVVFRVEVEAVHAAVGQVLHAIQGVAADVQYERHRKALGHLLVKLQQEFAIVFAADQIAGGVVGKGQGIGAGLDLGDAQKRMEDRDDAVDLGLGAIKRLWRDSVGQVVANPRQLHRQALEILSHYRIGGLYVPALPEDHDNDFYNNVGCLGGGNIIPHPPVADPSTGLMYVSHRRTCSAPTFMAPTGGVDVDNRNYAVPSATGATPNTTPTTGTTVVPWLPRGARRPTDAQTPFVRVTGLPTIDGLRLYKPMDNQLTAFQMNTGRRIWSLPVGETPARIRNHPLLAGVEVPNTGGIGWSIQMVAGDLLVQTRSLSQGEAQYDPDAPLELHARDKRTGEILASVPLPAPGQYGMMTYMHEGKQYIVVQIGSFRTDFPGALVAYALP